MYNECNKKAESKKVEPTLNVAKHQRFFCKLFEFLIGCGFWYSDLRMVPPEAPPSPRRW